jgi:carboxyl-terminal processing protease
LAGPAAFVLPALIVGFFFFFFISVKPLERLLSLQKGNKVDLLLDIINEDYVDTISTKDLTEGAITKIVSELDPHSAYIPASALETINENMEGHFAGVGINTIFYLDTIIINSLISGGPAEQAGLLAGDRIITINDSLIAGNHLPEEKIVQILHGKLGSSIKLGILRNGNLKDYKLTRTYVPLSSIKAAYEIAGGIGIIKIYDSFTNTTYDEFIGAMAKLLNKGCNSFIIDLRMNKGGAFESAVHICNEFLAKGQTIVYMEGRSFPREYVTANGLGTLQDKQVVILMDQISASASEIVAGAIQDNDRGLIIGRRSFGKGLVQNQIELSDGSAVRLTIARYFTPSGRNIQRKYVLGKAEEYNKEWFDRMSTGEGLYNDSKSMALDTSKVYSTLNGRKVYGGGGIMPDIFVPLDTTDITSYYVQLENKGIFNQYAFEYSDTNRSKLKAFTNTDDMLLYLKKQIVLSDVVRFAETKGIKRRTNLINISASQILNMTYAHILQNFFGDEAYFSLILNNDSMVKRAIEEIQRGNDTPQAVAAMKYKKS